VNSSHPLGVATSEVVVHRDEVHAFARQSIEVRGQGGHEGLSFTGFHFGDPPKVKRCTTHQLHVVVALSNHTGSRLAHRRECVDQQVIKIFPAIKARAKLGGLALQGVVRQSRVLSGSGVDVGDKTLEGLDPLAVTGSEDAVKDSHAKDEPTPS
jgi:hypothetical protein